MFITTAILFIICGILLLLRAKRMSKEHGLQMIASTGATILILSGAILIYCLLSEKIVLPLK